MKRVFAFLVGLAMPVEAQWRLERIASTAADADIDQIAGFAASRSGTLFVIDGKQQHIAVYDSLGQRIGTIGRKGRGPLEFSAAIGTAWHGDTLVVYDLVARRITLIRPDRTLLRTTPWTAPQLPSVLIGSGSGPIHFVAYGPGRKEPIIGLENANRRILPPKTFLRALGESIVPSDVTDTVPDPVWPICWARAQGHVYELDEVPGGAGPFNAITPVGALISVTKDRAQMLLRSGPRASVPFGQRYVPVRVTDALWGLEAAEYTDIEKREGPLTCQPAWTRPATLPAIRAVVTDDVGTVWAEITTDTGTRFDVYAPDGRLLGSVSAPLRRLRKLPFVVRGERLYVAEKDHDDIVSVAVYRLRR